jgi:hypothetical protein
MAENKRKAEEKRKSRLMLNTSNLNDTCSNETSTILPELNATMDTVISETTAETDENNSEILDVDMFLENLP